MMKIDIDTKTILTVITSVFLFTGCTMSGEHMGKALWHTAILEKQSAYDKYQIKKTAAHKKTETPQ